MPSMTGPTTPTDGTAPTDATVASGGSAAQAVGWRLDPAVAYLNHGSFGATPVPVLDAQAAYRDRMEAGPVRFLTIELPPLLGAVREELAAFVGADPAGLVFVPNASAGVVTALAATRSLLAPGDEILVTDHEYNATINAANALAEAVGARVVVARLPWPNADGPAIVAAIAAATGPRTRVAVVSHITSATAMLMPVGPIVALLEGMGVATIVDGAHGPGQVPLALDALGASWYTGNAHKWLCAPKGAAFLSVRGDRRAITHPLVTSHGRNAPVAPEARFLAQADWTGTTDPSAILAIPAALASVARLHPDGWRGVMAANHLDAIAARDRLLALTGGPVLVPDHATGAMVLIELPAGLPPALPTDDPEADPVVSRAHDPLGAALRADGVEVPVYGWPATPSLGPARRYLRVSWQRYVRTADIDRLIAALRRAAS